MGRGGLLARMVWGGALVVSEAGMLARETCTRSSSSLDRSRSPTEVVPVRRPRTRSRHSRSQSVLGYRYLETDVHLTRDGVLVAFHDERLDRVTDRTGAIAELGIAEVEAADAGHTFSPDGGRTFPFRGCGIRVPRLEAILARWPDARVNIDPKSDACVGPLAALLDRARRLGARVHWIVL